MKIWHDDIRVPPDSSWVWARTNAEAQALLSDNRVSEIGLDHDLGFDYLDPAITPNADFLRGTSEETGVHLIEWMLNENLLPEKIEIHSWSETGRVAMAEALADAGFDAAINPFDPACRETPFIA